jgi:hypothetical protein
MINKGVIATLAVVVLLSSVPFTNAQDFHLGLGINMSYCDFDKCVYTVSTGEMNVWGPYHSDSYSGNSWFSFWNGSSEDYYHDSKVYTVNFQAIFEAFDTNMDGTFTPGLDQHVGGIVQPRNELMYIPSFNWSDIVFEVQDNVTTAVHLKHTYNMTFTHQDSEYITTVPGWSGLPGHTNQMDINLELFVHFYLNKPNQFKIDMRVSGWEWTFSDSILVFVITVTEDLNQESPEPDIEIRDLEIVHEGNTLYFGQAWMEYSQNASADDETGPVQVQASQGRFEYLNLWNESEEYSAIFIAFQNFDNETLEYDPVFGLNPTDHPITPNEISYNQLLLTASLVTIGTIVVILLGEQKIYNNKALKTSA